jgi:hydrogenase maturation protease
MSVKVIAIGNILMRDDAIGIEIAKEIEEKLLEKRIKVIYGETNLQYSISSVKEEDYIIILDAAYYGKNPGEVTNLPLNTFISNKKGYSQHSYSFLDLLKLYYPNIKGIIYGIEVKEVEFGLGLSEFLQEKVKAISKEILNQIDKVLEENK